MYSETMRNVAYETGMQLKQLKQTCSLNKMQLKQTAPYAAQLMKPPKSSPAYETSISSPAYEASHKLTSL